MDHLLTRRSALGGGALLLAAACTASGSSERKQASDGSLLTLQDLDTGASARVDVEGSTVIVTRTGAQTAVAFDATCTHQGCQVDRRGQRLLCPCHGSAFDPSTGEVDNGPATRPLEPFPVKVQGGKIYPA